VTEVTSRELETLLQLACFHYLTSVQVAGFLFDGAAVTASTRSAGTRRALASLAQRNLIATTPRLIGGPGGGSARRAYLITPHGYDCLESHERRAGPPPMRRGMIFVEHALATAEVALAVRRGARAQPGHQLVSWESDWEIATALGDSPIHPDGRLVYALPGYEVDAFVEVDLSTERPVVFARKIARYLALYRSGTWRTRLVLWPVVLVVAPSAVRAVSLRRTTEAVLAGADDDARQGTEFRFASLEHLQAAGLAGAIWQVAGRGGLHPLVDPATVAAAG
jgi:hypothetical protein